VRCSFQGIHLLNTVSDVLTLLCQRCLGTAPTTVWALTREGFEVGSQRLGLKLERVPKHDVGQAFLKHEVMANEIFLGLVAQDGKTWAKVPRDFRWVLGEYLDLPFEEFTRVGSELEARRLQPDAMLEDPASQRRFFI